MQWYEAIFQTINLRSFSSIWYWITLLGLWMAAGHWPMGVPFDAVMRVRRDPADAQAARDLSDLTRIAAARDLRTLRGAGVLAVGLAAFLLSLLAALAVAGLELAQALVCFLGPMTVVLVMRLRLAARMEVAAADADAVCRALIWHRMFVQLVAMVSIFATAIWGMIRNLSVAVLN